MYYPKSQIKTNLYTSGGEYVIENEISQYIGPYYKTSNGKSFTGNTPGDGENKPLIFIQPSSMNEGNVDDSQPTNLITTIDTPQESYFDLVDNFTNNILYPNPTNLSTRIKPNHYQTLPQPIDYEVGKMVRYFSKKTNELKYKEISKETYTLLKNKDINIAWDLYEPEKIEWEIKGNKSIISRNNKTTITKIEQNKKWYGFSKYLKEDYLRYWKP
jgi:hypothetical protein